MKTFLRSRPWQSSRRGSVAVETVLALALLLPMTMTMLVVGGIACRHLYQVISTMVGAPYL